MSGHFERALEATVGFFGDPSAGFMAYRSAVVEVTKMLRHPTATPAANSLFAEISSALDLSPAVMFTKIESSFGERANLMISKATTSDGAAHALIVSYVEVDLARATIVKISKEIPNPLLPIIRAYEEKKIEESASIDSTDAVVPSDDSVADTESVVSQRIANEISAAPAAIFAPQIEVDFISEAALSTTETTFSAGPEDYSATLMTSGENLYSGDQPAPITLDLAPQFAKYAKLGIDPNRPSIIISSSLSQRYLIDSKAFLSLLAARELKVQQIYKNLDGIESSSDYSALVELYNANVEKSKTVISALEEVREVESKIASTVASDAGTEIAILGYSSEQKSTQAFLQAVYELGKIPFSGPTLWRPNRDVARSASDTENSMKIVSLPDPGGSDMPLRLLDFATVSNELALHTTGRNFLTRPDGRVAVTDLADGGPGSMAFPDESTTFVDGYDFTEPEAAYQRYGFTGLPDTGTASGYKRDAPTYADFFNDKCGAIRNGGGSLESSVPHICQLIYTELVMSKLVSAGNEAALEIQKVRFSGDPSSGVPSVASGLADYFVSDSIAAGNYKITDDESPKRIASIAKYSKSGQTYYPFEANLSELHNSFASDSPLDAKSFHDDILQNALGNIVEGKEYDINTIISWMNETQSQIEDYMKFTDLFIGDGSALIALNEIMVAFVDAMTGEDWLSHDIDTYKTAINNELGSYDILSRALLIINIIARCKDEAFSHLLVYNGMSWLGSLSDIGHVFKQYAEAWGDLIFSEDENIYSVIGDLYTAATALRDLDAGQQSYVHLTLDEALLPTAGHEDELHGLYPSRIMVVICAAACKIFQGTEIGLTNSISLLLADKGFISPEPNANYTSVLDGFFTIGDDGIERTVFSGIPKFRLRQMIHSALAGALDTEETSTAITYSDMAGYVGIQSSVRELMVKVGIVTTKNVDPAQGPVRWKITTGPTPIAESVYSAAAGSVNEFLIPTEVRKQMTSGMSDLNDDGTIDSSDDAVTGVYDFLNLEEAFCKLTYLIDGEDGGLGTSRVVFGNRGVLTALVDDFISYRAPAQLYKQFINSVLDPYLEIPSRLDALASNDLIATINEVAQYPGVEGTDVIAFDSAVQGFNRTIDMQVNKGNSAFRYFPAKYSMRTVEFQIADQVTRNAVSRECGGKWGIPATDSTKRQAVVHSVGLPTGILSQNPYSNFTIGQYIEHLPTSFYYSAEPNTYTFVPFLYFVPGSLALCAPEPPPGIGSGEGSEWYNGLRFMIIGETGIAKFVDYADGIESIKNMAAVDDATARVIVQNHLISYCLGLTLEILQGTQINENMFRYDKDFCRLLVDPDEQKIASSIIPGVPDVFSDYFDGSKVKNMHDVLRLDNVTTGLDASLLLGCLESRLFSSATISTSFLGARMFDRVFNLVTSQASFEFFQSVPSGTSAPLSISELFINNPQPITPSGPTSYVLDVNHGQTDRSNALLLNNFSKYSYSLDLPGSAAAAATESSTSR